jgi:hypothetical protein
MFAYNYGGTAAFTIAMTSVSYVTGMPILHYGNGASPQKAPQVGPYYTTSTALGNNPAVTAVLTAAYVPYISYTVQ